MKIVRRDILKSLRTRIEESKKKIRQDEEDIVYQKQIICESNELIGRIEHEED